MSCNYKKVLDYSLFTFNYSLFTRLHLDYSLFTFNYSLNK